MIDLLRTEARGARREFPRRRSRMTDLEFHPVAEIFPMLDAIRDAVIVHWKAVA